VVVVIEVMELILCVVGVDEVIIFNCYVYFVGGVCMGCDEWYGVVDVYGCSFGVLNLLVIDGSMLLI